MAREMDRRVPCSVGELAERCPRDPEGDRPQPNIVERIGEGAAKMAGPHGLRLILHTAAYWLILTMRDTIPATHALATAEFATIRLRLLKLGTRVIETASRVCLAFAAACPEAMLFRRIAAAVMPTGP